MSDRVQEGGGTERQEDGTGGLGMGNKGRLDPDIHPDK